MLRFVALCCLASHGFFCMFEQVRAAAWKACGAGLADPALTDFEPCGVLKQVWSSGLEPF